MMKRIMLTLCAAGALSIATGAMGHHSVQAGFDLSEFIEIEGVVVDFKFRSPHSSLTLDVMQDGGAVEHWEVEASSVPTMTRSGITADTFKPGDRLQIFGFPSRRGKSGMYGMRFITADGTVLEDSSATSARVALPGNPDALGVEKIAGRWRNPPFRAYEETSPLPLNEAGLAAWAGYDPTESPGNSCTPLQLPTLLYSPNYLYEVQIDGDEIVLHHEAYDMVRKVTLNATPQPAEDTGWLGGLVSGRVEGETLIIESTNFPASKWGLAIAALHSGGGADIPSSDRKRLVERYSASEDGARLWIDYTVEDPVYLSEPYSTRVELTRMADDTPLHRYGCEDDAAAESGPSEYAQ